MVANDAELIPKTSLVLIRHGESVGNATRTITHFRTCSGLSDEGRAQCELLAKRIDRTRELAGAVLYASHVCRAIETAEFVAPVIGSEIHIDERFAELDPGEECDGMTYEDLIARHDPDWSLDDPDGVIYPGGETVAGLHRRVAAGKNGGRASSRRQRWWAPRDSNPDPKNYEFSALTNCAKGPARIL